jgi:DNA-binding transcriptional ArsR family regulator
MPSGILAPNDRVALEAAREAMPTKRLLEVVVETCAALADGTRARILYALIKGPLCVRDLALLTGVSESAVSHQLRLLKDRRLVQAARRGNFIHYSLDDHHIAALFKEAEYHADHVLQSRPDHDYPAGGQ